jgi:ferrous iron transport protein B
VRLRDELVVALAGNPNVGKTTLFNALTGLKQKVANYPGVTVEKKVGRCLLKGAEGGGGSGTEGAECQIIDLPGTYSLASRSPDEHVARQVVLGQIAGTPRPEVVVVVADANNLERNLYLVTQVLELGRPVVVALTMVDVAQGQGKKVDVDKLGRHLRAPVVQVQAHKGAGGTGLAELKAEIAKAAKRSVDGPLALPLPEIMETHIERLKRILASEGLSAPDQAYFDAHLMLSTGDEQEEEIDLPDKRRGHPRVRAEITEALEACAAADVDPISAEVEAHYTFISSVVSDCVREETAGKGHRVSKTDRIDRIVTHRVWGMGVFIGLMGVMFWAIFSWAQPVMDFLKDDVVGGLGTWIGGAMGEGPLRSLIVDGVFAGVGNVVVFLPQIALLFLFLAVLEDSGYMSRAAFLMDRLMSKVGLHGKSFIPLLSGYACAVPAIMGTRVIENRRDRLATILILPLMSCSARLPVYSLLIALFFGSTPWLAALVMLSMYLLGTFTAFGLAWVFKRTLLKGPAPAFILEMPPYRVPHWKVVITTVSQRCWAFLKRAGTVIFAFSVVMWAATNYPNRTSGGSLGREVAQLGAQVDAKQGELNEAKSRHVPGEEMHRLEKEAEELRAALEVKSNELGQARLEGSAAGSVGRAIAPVFYPLGYDWKTSIGVAGAFFAREVIVSTMGIVYSVGDTENSTEALQGAMKADVWPAGTGRAGQKIWTPLVAVSLMVFVVFCMQCLSTLAVAKREMGHWGWPVFMFAYMTALAWVAAFVVYQGGMLLGLGR